MHSPVTSDHGFAGAWGALILPTSTYAFLNGVPLGTQRKLVEELDDLNGTKLQLTLTVELEKARPNGEN